jgi:hypothetical protein
MMVHGFPFYGNINKAWQYEIVKDQTEDEFI